MLSTFTIMLNRADEEEYRRRLDAAGVPEHLHEGLVGYLVHRIPPGHFLIACLENNLSDVMSRADETSRAGLFSIVKFLYNDAPNIAWGSQNKVTAWLARTEDIDV